MKEKYLKRMKEYLKEEYDAYEESLSKEVYRGIRVNTSKISIDDFKALSICELTPSSICPQSFYIPYDTQGLGNHVAHMAGLFYMQEPSASSAVEILDVQKNDWVLDLCSAPGGKSTQIAAKLHHSGLLVSNEIDGKRAQILLSNFERLGFSECMITNSHPEIICEEMQGCFDRVLVDAPCSGEGMFKKHSKAMEDWSEEHVQACAARQKHILDSAYKALKENGILVYSTCTYAIEENEEVIYDFLKKYPDMQLLDAKGNFGRAGLEYKNLNSSYLRRILPMDKGEGHFIAKLQKKGYQTQANIKEVYNANVPAFVLDFFVQQLKEVPPYYMQIHEQIYAKYSPFIKLSKTKILRQGIRCGDIVKNRIEPHQHFYTASIHCTKWKQRYEMSEEECDYYIKGNVLQVAGYKGYTALTWKQYPMAFGKGDGTQIKNKYPKGMRRKGN